MFFQSIFNFLVCLCDLQILFRVSVTLIVSNKAALMAAEDITALANLFRALVKDERTVNCHDFMQSIFVVPGKLTRAEIANARKAANLTPK